MASGADYASRARRGLVAVMAGAEPEHPCGARALARCRLRRQRDGEIASMMTLAAVPPKPMLFTRTRRIAPGTGAVKGVAYG